MFSNGSTVEWPKQVKDFQKKHLKVQPSNQLWDTIVACVCYSPIDRPEIQGVIRGKMPDLLQGE